MTATAFITKGINGNITVGASMYDAVPGHIGVTFFKDYPHPEGNPVCIYCTPKQARELADNLMRSIVEAHKILALPEEEIPIGADW